MPSPIAHLSVGYAIYRISKQSFPGSHQRFWMLPLQLLIVTGLSMLPDLDVLLAFAMGDMEKYHNNFSHSFIFAFFVALFFAIIFYWINRSHFWLWFFVILLSYEFHILLDFFTAERGVMLFWPFTQERFAAPVKLFYGVQWGLGWFSVWHLWTIFTEAIFSAIVILPVIYFEKWRAQKASVLSNEN